MLSSSIPPKFSIPWANSAPAANVRNIPTNSQISVQAGAASLSDGFPPLNFIPVSAGGVPPFGADMNGILQQTTRWLQWVAAGGTTRYDAAFVSAIAGYPAGAQLMSNTGHAVYESMVDNNSTDPNAGGANWRVQSCVWSGSVWPATGSSNVQVVNLSPAPTSLSQLTGIPIRILSQGTNTGDVTINVNGLGAIPVQQPGGTQLAGATLLTGYPFEVVLQSTSAFILLSRSSTFFDSGNSGVTVQGTTSAGATLLLTNNGNAKFIRAVGSDLRIDNSSSSNILLLTNSGVLSTTGAISSGGLLRATTKATGSGDSQAATILGDFPTIVSAVGFDGPNNYLLQTIPSNSPSGVCVFQAWDGINTTGSDIIAFPTAFPTKCVQLVVCEGDPSGWSSGTVPTVFGAQQLGNTAFALYVSGWNTTLGTWSFHGGVAYRIIAIGY